MPVYAEKKENGALVNICATRPEKRNTTLEIVQLKHMPQYELVHPEGLDNSVPLKYDPDTQTAVLHEEVWNAEREQERKNEILYLIRTKRDIHEAQEAYGIDYSTDLAKLEARLLELTT
jgi:hypothetical protein